jgi:cyclase
MKLPIRIIPLILMSAGLVKKPVKFKNPRTIANIMSIIKVFENRDVDELVFLNIDRNYTFYRNIINKISRELYCPFTYGGGIKQLSDAIQIYKKGAEKISFNSALFENPDLISSVIKKFGSQAVTISLDYNSLTSTFFYNSGKIDSKRGIKDIVNLIYQIKPGEVILNSINHEGTMRGFNIELIKLFSPLIECSLLVAGGAGNYNDIYEVAKLPISGILIGSLFHYTKITPNNVKSFLLEKKIHVRKDSQTLYTH